MCMPFFEISYITLYIHSVALLQAAPGHSLIWHPLLVNMLTSYAMPCHAMQSKHRTLGFHQMSVQEMIMCDDVEEAMLYPGMREASLGCMSDELDPGLGLARPSVASTGRVCTRN
jgi:hypothetical protein